jgi:hypothetical protein
MTPDPPATSQPSLQRRRRSGALQSRGLKALPLALARSATGVPRPARSIWNAASRASAPTTEGHWVAELECGHRQHMRHRPPFERREWVTTPEGR